MGYIHYNLIQSSNCAGMAPAPIAGGGFGPAVLPAGMGMAGMYIIVNTTTNNRYIGISNDIQTRFTTRLATVTEMGFGALTMQRIGLTWGSVLVRDTMPAVVPAGGWPAAGFVAVVPAAPAAFTATIDAVPGVNLEKLLIRFVITQLGAGGTVSNNAMAAAPYVNPTPNPITVRLSWGAMGGLFAANHHDAVWGVGGVGW